MDVSRKFVAELIGTFGSCLLVAAQHWQQASQLLIAAFTLASASLAFHWHSALPWFQWPTALDTFLVPT